MNEPTDVPGVTYDGDWDMYRGQHCPNKDCDGVDTFYRWVSDTIDSDLEGNTGQFENCGDGDATSSQYRGIWCNKCEQKVVGE